MLADADSALPSPVITESAGQAPRSPDSESLHDQSIVTSPLNQPSVDGAVVAAPVMVGAVSSMSIPDTVALSLLSAASVALPVTDWLCPSPNSAVGEQSLTPESASWQTKPTVTFALYQPYPLGERSGEPEMVGLVLSTLTVAVSLAVLPATSAACPTTTWDSPSAVTGTGAEQEAMPDRPSWSAQSNVTVTSVLFHLAAFGWGETWWPIVGADRSMRTVADCRDSTLPASSTLQTWSSWMPWVSRVMVLPVWVPPPSTM